MSVKRDRKLPIVALVGRTNVGKSTLWNRLTDEKNALVSPEPHTTRDRRYARVVWQGSVFELIDTGGMDVENDAIGHGIHTQSRHAIEDADLVLFVVDAQAGMTETDRRIGREVAKCHKRVWLLANKTDNIQLLPLAHQGEFFQLGFGAARGISAATSFGIGDLLDDIHAELHRLGTPPISVAETDPLRIVIIGRPNVGKSSLTNAILGEERVIVSPIPHTTREPQDSSFRYQDRDMILIDTAGMRTRSKITAGIEEQSIERNKAAIDRADVALLVFDVTQDPTTQDRHLAGLMEKQNKGLILVANKWDLIPHKTTASMQQTEILLRQLFPFLSWAPVTFVSAKEHQRTTQLLDLALQVQAERHRHIEYNALNRLLKTCIKAMKPLASYGPKSPRIYDVAQIGHAPPSFQITVIGEKDNIHPNWVRFFQKRLREKFGFIGTAIEVKVRHVPLAKSENGRYVQGPGMEAVAGKIREKKVLVNQTRRRQKYR